MNNLIEYNEQNILRLKGIYVDFSYHASPSNLTRYVNLFQTRGCNSIMKKIYKNRGLNRSTSKDCSDEFIGGGYMINYLTFQFLNLFLLIIFN